MKSEKEFLKETYDKNKPKLLFPIFNTVLGVGLAGILVYLTIYQDLKIGILIFAIFLLVLFIASSWYNSYFSKKQVRKEIYNLQEETEILINTIKNQKRKQIYEINDIHKIKFSYNLDETKELEKVSFDLKTRTFSKDIKGLVEINLGVSCAGLLVNPSTKEVVGFGGMAPCSVWLKKKLNVPASKKGNVYIDTPGYKLTDKTVFKVLRQSDAYYDKKTGWLCFGSKKTESIDDVIEVQENVYVVLRDEELISVWVKLEPNLEIA
ncbi:MAG: ABC transporter ATP-binding protein [Bacilli bacterium]|nr:ABC transporter ATP-binding protein [Bacilli bacterium]